jgi:hypothetical protein
VELTNVVKCVPVKTRIDVLTYYNVGFEDLQFSRMWVVEGRIHEAFILKIDCYLVISVVTKLDQVGRFEQTFSSFLCYFKKI